jgi:hypothetical protein
MKTDPAKKSRTVDREPSRAPHKPSRPPGNRDPRAPTEDEADILYGEKHKNEKGIPWEQVKAKLDEMDR